MTKFLHIDEGDDAPLLINLDHVIAIRCENYHDDNAKITFVLNDWDVCEKHHMVTYGRRECDYDENVWWTEARVIMMGRYETARAAIFEALGSPDAVVDMTTIADKHGALWDEARA